jgi:hypothetical protein
MRKYVEDPKIIAWFGQVNRDAITFEKFTAIPLGILRDEQYFEQSKKYNDFFKQMRNKQKTKLAYVNFTVHEGRFDGRGDIYNLFKDEPFCMVSRPKPFLDYMDETAQCKFVISPEGDMHDCYRHWEALLVGTIPVVHASPADCLFDELPVVIVNDYKEVNEEFLHKKYEELKHKNYNFRKLYMQYWIDKIDAAREKFFASQRN